MLLLVCLLASAQAVAQSPRLRYVARVLDGDTLVLDSGTRIRLLGLDAPESGEPFSAKAEEWLAGKALGRQVAVASCEEKDRYGRTLASVTLDGENLNLALLREGLAVPMLIPPCGGLVAEPTLAAASEALMARRRLYRDIELLPHAEAAGFIGQRVHVYGKILEIHRGPKALHLNFGADWRTDFTAVLFGRGQERFRSLGLDPADLEGRTVVVSGKLKEYYGPEIVVSRPEQLLVVHGDGR